MKYPKTIQKMLDNKIVLYVVMFFAITNFIGYAILGNYMALILFLVFGSLTYLVEPNKVMVLLVPLILTSLLMIGKRVKEGFEGDEDPKKKLIPADGTTTNGTATNGTATNGTATNGTATNGTGTTDTGTTDVATNGTFMTDVATNDTGTTDVATNDTFTTDTATTGTAQTEPMSNKKARNRIDYASTIEDAYGNLSQILGSDGIKGLTDDTHKLMKQQLELAEAMKSMTPIVEQAQHMLQGIDIKNLGGLADLAKQFTGGNKAPGNSLIQQV
jgi:hypothetical protein